MAEREFKTAYTGPNPLCCYCYHFIHSRRMVRTGENDEGVKKQIERFCAPTNTMRMVTTSTDGCKHFMLAHFFLCYQESNRMAIEVCQNRYEKGHEDCPHNCRQFHKEVMIATQLDEKLHPLKYFRREALRE